MKPKVKEYMSTDLKSVAHNAKVSEACSLFWKHSINHIPITNEEGEVIGMFSTTDAMKMFHEKVLKNPIIQRKDIDELLNLSDFINPGEMQRIESDSLITHAKLTMHKHGINSLLVYDKNELVGILSSKDLP